MSKAPKRSERKINLSEFVDPATILPQGPSSYTPSPPPPHSSFPSQSFEREGRDNWRGSGAPREESSGGGGWRGSRDEPRSREPAAPQMPSASEEDFQWRKRQPMQQREERVVERATPPPSQADEDVQWRKAKPIQEPAAVAAAAPQPSQAEQDTQWRKVQAAPAEAAVQKSSSVPSEADTSASWRSNKPKEQEAPSKQRPGFLRRQFAEQAGGESSPAAPAAEKTEEPAASTTGGGRFAAFKAEVPAGDRFAAFNRQERTAEPPAVDAAERYAAFNKPPQEEGAKPSFLRRGPGAEDFPAAFRSGRDAPAAGGPRETFSRGEFPAAFRSRETAAEPRESFARDEFPASFKKPLRAEGAGAVQQQREDFPSAFQGGGGLRRFAPDPTFRREDYQDRGSSSAFSRRGGGDDYQRGGGGFRAGARQDDASFGAFRSSTSARRFDQNEPAPLPSAPASVLAAKQAAAQTAAPPAPVQPAPAAPKPKKNLEQSSVMIRPMIKDYLVDENRPGALAQITATLGETDAPSEFLAKVTEQLALAKADSNKEKKLVYALLSEVAKKDLKAFCEGLCQAYDANQAQAKEVFDALSASHLPELAKETFRVPFVPAVAEANAAAEAAAQNESKEIKLLKQILAEADLAGDEEMTWVKKNSSKLAKLYDAGKEERIQAVCAVEDAFQRINFQPKGRVEEAFQALFDVCVLSKDAFIDWRDDPKLMDQPTPGRQRALFQTTDFFLDLEEEEEDDEEEEEDDYDE